MADFRVVPNVEHCDFLVENRILWTIGLKSMNTVGKWNENMNQSFYDTVSSRV